VSDRDVFLVGGAASIGGASFGCRSGAADPGAGVHDSKHQSRNHDCFLAAWPEPQLTTQLTRVQGGVAGGQCATA